MDFKIVDVSELDCHLIVRVEHYNADDSFWHVENYRWQGREGLKQKRQTDASGRLLLDNGVVAPTRVSDNGRDPGIPYLPDSRDWAYYPAPHMDTEDILTTIRRMHTQRLVTGWPTGIVDMVGRMAEARIIQRDRDGCLVLVTAFESLVGYTE